MDDWRGQCSTAMPQTVGANVARAARQADAFALADANSNAALKLSSTAKWHEQQNIRTLSKSLARQRDKEAYASLPAPPIPLLSGLFSLLLSCHSPACCSPRSSLCGVNLVPATAKITCARAHEYVPSFWVDTASADRLGPAGWRRSIERRRRN
jgi:hypothetical protein